MKKLNLKEAPRAWTWELEDGSLCYYAYSKKVLLANGKPSPGAKPVCVRLVKNSKFKKRR